MLSKNIVPCIVLFLVLVIMIILFVYNIKKVKGLYQTEHFGLMNTSDLCTVSKASDKDEYILKTYASQMCTCPVALNYNPSQYVPMDKAINVFNKICSQNGQEYCKQISTFLK